MRMKHQSGVQGRLSSLPCPLCLRGMKVTAPNLTWRDGNLSDTANNLLMQKLKGLSVSLGGVRAAKRSVYNGADIQTTGFCPLLKATKAHGEKKAFTRSPSARFPLPVIWRPKHFYPELMCLFWRQSEEISINNESVFRNAIISALSFPFEVRRNV